MKLRRAFSHYVTAIPVMATIGMFLLYPLANVVRLSFYKSDYVTEKFIGLGNYVVLASDPKFWNAITNSIIYGLAFVVGEVGIGLPIALLLFDMSKRWKNGIRLTLLVPLTAAGIVISQVWLWIFNPTYGLANWLLSLIDLGPVAWLSTRAAGTGVICTVIALTLPGGGVILMLAALISVPKEILEAAKVDGASPWQVRLLIVVPYIRLMILLLFLIAFIGGMQVWEFVYAITGGGPLGSTASVMYYIYDQGLLRSKYGLGAAATILFISVVSFLSWQTARIQKRW